MLSVLLFTVICVNLSAMAIKFSVLTEDEKTNARSATLETPHGRFETPVFMPVGTLATVRALTADDLKELGIKIILSNAYHLALRPGMEIIKKAGGLHRFMAWDGSILTDSGGFQVFSLSKTLKVTDDGVVSRSLINGSRVEFTPESVIKIQETLGSDIAMVLDQCSSYPEKKEKVAEAVQRTTKWAESSLKSLNSDMAVFGIVQGGIFKDLRIESAQQLVELDFPGYAIGGLSVGEPRDEMVEMLEVTCPLLSKDKPRYLMGVGDPLGIIEAVKKGVDMFDCVLPTRTARNGRLFTSSGTINIKNSAYKDDMCPIDEKCECKVCKKYSRAYLRHLFTSGEMLGPQLATFHNVAFLIDLMDQIRNSIKKGKFSDLAKDKVKSFC
jgi:queuine tRNA-ribosyltransferase